MTTKDDIEGLSRSYYAGMYRLARLILRNSVEAVGDRTTGIIVFDNEPLNTIKID